MMKALRRHKDWLMIVIAILAIPFVFYFVRTPDYGQMRSDQFTRMYDRNVSMLEAQQIVRLFVLAQKIGMSEFVQTLTAGAGQNQNQVTVQFIINLLVLRHEAQRLGLRPDASEVADVVRKLPAFQSESGFDMNKFSDFVRSDLGPLGLGEEHIEKLVRDELCLNEIKRLLAAGISISKGELDENFQRGYDKFYVNIIRLQSADFDKDITIKDEDVQKYYDAHKAELKTDEKRKVQFISLGLSEDQKKLTGKERIEVLQKLSDRATDFTQALLEKGADFKQAAEKFQLSVHETGEFTAAAPDPQLKVDAQLGVAAFKLSAQEPNSDPVQVADGFYILHLVGKTEARPLTVEEAKPKIVDTLKKGRARELMATKGAELTQQLREAAKSGQPLEASIQKAGAKAERLPPFSLFEEEKPKSEGNEAKKEPPVQDKESKNEPSSQGKEPTNQLASQGSNEPKSEQPSQSKESKNEQLVQSKEAQSEPPAQGKEAKSEPPVQDKESKNELSSQGKEPQNELASQGNKEPKNKSASKGRKSKNKLASQGKKSKNQPALQGKEPNNEPASQDNEPKNEPPSQSKEPTGEPSDLAAIKEAVAFLGPGEISDFTPSGNDGFIAVLEKRETSADTDVGEKKAAFEKRIRDNKERIVFYEWLRERQQAAGLQFSKG